MTDARLLRRVTNRTRVLNGYFFYHPQLIKIDELSVGTYVKVVEKHEGPTVTVVRERDIASFTTAPQYVIMLSDLTYNR